MAYYYLMFSFLLISSIFLVDHAVAYTVEGIIGGYRAYPANYKYHASMIGIYNNSNVPYLMCAAGIVTDYLLISAAICLVMNDQLRKLTFYAVVDQVVISGNAVRLRGVEKVYAYSFNNALNKNDLVVVKLSESLQSEGTTFKTLEIPSEDEFFYNRTGTVTGFGAESIFDVAYREGRGRVRLNLLDPRYLRYAFVEITSDTVCSSMYSYIFRLTSFCGVMKQVVNLEHRGICVGDLGTPFVIGDKVYGIATKCSSLCNDVQYGALYTKVSQYKSFIEGIKNGNPVPDTVVYHNYPHAHRTRT